MPNYAVKVGEGLLKAKEKVPHGEWENWLKMEAKGNSGFPFGTKHQANKYMRLAKEKELSQVLLSHDSSFNLLAKN